MMWLELSVDGLATCDELLASDFTRYRPHDSVWALPIWAVPARSAPGLSRANRWYFPRKVDVIEDELLQLVVKRPGPS